MQGTATAECIEKLLGTCAQAVLDKKMTVSKPAQRIRAIRRGLDMTQMQFAHELSITVSCVSNWERGIYKPSGLAEQAIRHLCVSYGLDLNTMRRFA